MTASRPVFGAIAAGHHLTAEAGAAMLREGGNAFDAAIASLAMACVCEPVLASPGGGGFAMLRDGATGETVLLDFFPHTPRKRRAAEGEGVFEVHADFGSATQRFHIGPATAATPGFAHGIAALAAHGARFSNVDHVVPATTAARAGITVTPYQHYLSTVVRPILMATPEAAALFAPGGDVPVAGAVVFNPELAEALESLASSDPALGEIAGLIAESQGRGHGNLTIEDLRRYRPEAREPVQVDLGTAHVSLNPLPAASGILIARALSRLHRKDCVGMALALRDADVARIEAAGDLSVLAGRPIRQKGTTHISVVDCDGNACSLTVSNGEGNGEIVPGCGFMLNNILGEEDVNPFGARDWPEDARLASMMCPTIVDTRDDALIVLGSGGSNRIRSAIFQTVVRMAVLEHGIHRAVEAPRLHVEAGHLDYENHFTPVETEELQTVFPDHRAWNQRNMFFGGVHAVRRCRRGDFDGVGDLRRDGVFLLVD